MTAIETVDEHMAAWASNGELEAWREVKAWAELGQRVEAVSDGAELYVERAGTGYRATRKYIDGNGSCHIAFARGAIGAEAIAALAALEAASLRDAEPKEQAS